MRVSTYLDREQFVKDSSATLSGLGNKAHRTNLAGGKQIDADDWQTLGNTFPGRQTQYFRRICSFRVAGRKKNQYVYLETGRQGMHLATEAKKLSFSQAKS